MYADETSADELQAWHDSRVDADLDMAAMAATGAAQDRAIAAGRCLHFSVVGPRNPAGTGLKPQELRCTPGCGRVFTDDDDWYKAMDEAVDGA